jgi:arylsulfatase A-like enzyme
VWVNRLLQHIGRFLESKVVRSRSRVNKFPIAGCLRFETYLGFGSWDLGFPFGCWTLNVERWTFPSLIKPRFSLSLTRLIVLLLCVFSAQATFGEASPIPQSNRHVVILVWDGMRPDFISESNTPALWKFAREGVTFRNHHSVYPTMTDVNGSAIATGAYPNKNGLLANQEYRSRIDSKKPYETAALDVIRKGDATSNGKYLLVPTVAEAVRASGRTVAIAGTKSVAFLHDRSAEWTSAVSQKNGLVRFAAAPMPPSLRDQMLQLLGPLLIESTDTSDARNAYATRALTEILWRDGVPAYSLLWLSDPDLTQHEHSPGAEPSIAAIRSSDRNLANVLEALSKKNVRDQTDVFIVSDHGFSTIERAINFPETVRAAGFEAFAAFEETSKPGQIMVVENAGSILFYIIEHDRKVAARLVEWLQRSDFAGVIFSREKFNGTFPLDAVRANVTEAPDVIVALRWNPKANQFGIPGHIITDATRKAGQGSHATLSEYDVHNTLIAGGPHFRRGFESKLPSGNIDLAPTILHILGLNPASRKFDGRILSEALAGGSDSMQAKSETLEAKRKFNSGEWHQHLRVSRVAGTTYFDEGNGEFEKPNKP